MREKTWVKHGTRLCIVLLIILSFVVVAVTHNKSSTCRISPSDTNLLIHGEKAIAVPIRYDNGVFLVDLWIDNQQTQAVVDTGSEDLIVSSVACDLCNDDFGDITISANEQLPTQKEIIAYGTQVDHLYWVKRDVTFLGKSFDSLDELEKSPMKKKTFPKRVMGAVVQRTGSSNYNIMGLNKGFSETAFLRSILPEKNMVFTVIFNGKSGWLVFGQTPYFSRVLHFIPILPDPRAIGLPYNFYVARVSGFQIGDTIIDDPHIAPKYLLVDTGSNMMSVPPALFDKMNELGVNDGVPGGPDIIFRMPSRTAGDTIVVTYSNDVYRWKPTSELLIDPELIFEDVQASKHLIVIGSLFFNQFIMQFNDTDCCIGIMKM